MSLDLRRRLFDQLDALVLVDPHTHINPLDPASHTLADILGYHYYTELAHSAGMPKEQIEEAGLDPKEKVRRLIENLGPIDNTIQHSWFVEMAQTFFDLEGNSVNADNWESLYDTAAARMAEPDWSEQVLAKSKLEAVFLTNDFDDPLEGFDTNVYVPCLRTDDLVFHLAKPEVRERLERATGMAAGDARALRRAIGQLFRHFKSRGARACAISLPPDFAPAKVSAARANTALAAVHAEGTAASESHRRAIGNYVFWTLAELCADFRLPFDLMIGVNRGVYAGGVHQGRDLYDSRVSLVQYKELFNAFPQVTFPISVLASVTNQELTSYAWIFPNVVTSGHWWYSNTPTFIEHDLAARLEAVPRTKQLGYYSDMYKLEFALPKFAMYKRILAKVLAERFVIDRGWSEESAVALGKQVLRGNVERIFRWGEDLREELAAEEEIETAPIAAAATMAAPFAAPFTAPISEPEMPEGLEDPAPLAPAEDLRIEPSPAADDGGLDLFGSPEPEAMPAPAPMENENVVGDLAEPMFDLAAEPEQEAAAEEEAFPDFAAEAEAEPEVALEEEVEFSLESSEEEPAAAEEMVAASGEDDLEGLDLGMAPAEEKAEEEDLDLFAFGTEEEPAAEAPAETPAEEEIISLEEEPAPAEPEPEPAVPQLSIPEPTAKPASPFNFTVPDAPKADTGGGWSFNIDTSKSTGKKKK